MTTVHEGKRLRKVLDETDVRIIEELNEDGRRSFAAVARNLGLSLRTVRRRIAALMNDLGVDTRFQAGVEAARRGWL